MQIRNIKYMAEKLKEYKRKRDFDKTAEPEGKLEKRSKKLRFVVQHHIASREHFDLRLEFGGVLLSWAVPKGASFSTADKRLAVRVEDHPLSYRDFEGTIPKGEYGGGTVMVWDEGYWESETDIEKGLQEGSLKFTLLGKRLKGKWALVRFKTDGTEKNDNWLLIKEQDAFAKTNAGIKEYKTSVKTGRTMTEIANGEKPKTGAKNPFAEADAQLCKAESVLPDSGDWLYEIKYDGYRILAYTEAGGVRLLTRNGNDYTKKFSPVADSLIDWADGRAAVLDGEIVITDSAGKTDFQALQNYLKKPTGKKLKYVVFDILALDGKDLRSLPLIKRKERLKEVLAGAADNIVYSPHIESGGGLLKAACEKNLEGVIAKKAQSVYSGSRGGDWVKVKCYKGQEFVIGGYTVSEKKLYGGGISSLLLGYFENGGLVYAGRTGTGFTEKTSKELAEKLNKLKRKTPPFKDAPKAKSGEDITWVKAELAAEVMFVEWTDENLLRQASFKGLRGDKEIKSIVREDKAEKTEKTDGQKSDTQNERCADCFAAAKTQKRGDTAIIEGVRLTNSAKLLYTSPDISKAEVAEYYSKISVRMLPYVQNRILSLICCPKGIGEECFYKKHAAAARGLKTVPVINSKGESEEYFCVSDSSGIIWQVQMNTLEFHIWGSTADKPDMPDMMIFDLDPDEGMALQRVRQGAVHLKNILDELNLKSYLKTSGGKGYHVVVPFKPSKDWESFRAFAKKTAELMEQKYPDLYTINMRKDKRKGKIFIDWMRNIKGSTSIAPYSIRARKGAKVSMPIAWSDLSKTAPDSISMSAAIKSLTAPDPWKDFFKTAAKQSLKQLKPPPHRKFKSI